MMYTYNYGSNLRRKNELMKYSREIDIIQRRQLPIEVAVDRSPRLFGIETSISLSFIPGESSPFKHSLLIRRTTTDCL